MLVDDDNISSFIYRKIIEMAGLDISHLKTFLKGQEALEHLVNNLDSLEDFPDFILLDINMPVMDGWGFLDEYSANIAPKLKKRVVICMLSSSVNVKDRERAFSYKEVKDYANKPLTSTELEKLITTHFTD